MTVTGPVDASELKMTLPHEHIYINFNSIPDRFDYPDFLDDDEVLAEELASFGNLGGSCVVDATPSGVGRKPYRLHQMARRTGLSIVMGCGWYREPYYPNEASIERRSVDSLAAELIHEINEGVTMLGIRPGLIGEIGIQGPYVSPIEERVHRAAARAQKVTGLPLLLHSIIRDCGLDQIAVAVEEGVDPTRIAVGHADHYPMLDYYLSIVKLGAYVALDGFGIRTFQGYEERLITLILELIDRGYQQQILLSQDVCRTVDLERFGGRGYTYLQKTILPRLRDAGLPETALTDLMSGNPLRWLTVGQAS